MIAHAGIALAPLGLVLLTLLGIFIVIAELADAFENARRWWRRKRMERKR